MLDIKSKVLPGDNCFAWLWLKVSHRSRILTDELVGVLSHASKTSKKPLHFPQDPLSSRISNKSRIAVESQHNSGTQPFRTRQTVSFSLGFLSREHYCKTRFGQCYLAFSQRSNTILIKRVRMMRWTVNTPRHSRTLEVRTRCSRYSRISQVHPLTIQHLAWLWKKKKRSMHYPPSLWNGNDTDINWSLESG